jgi:hypothetical protein
LGFVFPQKNDWIQKNSSSIIHLISYLSFHKKFQFKCAPSSHSRREYDFGVGSSPWPRALWN